MNDLSDLEAKARAATQGEWSVLTSSLDSTRSIMAGDPAFFLARCHKSPVSDATANAAYIAAAQPRVVLELIERIRTAEAKAGEPVACGGCGNSDPAKRCIGCMHDFAAPVDTAALAERAKTLEEALGKIELACISEDDVPDKIVEIVFVTAAAARAALGGSNE